jgi:hypothetical protein
MKKLLPLLLAGTLVLGGCSTAWLSTLDNYVKIAGPILIQILDLVAIAKGVPVNAALQAKITADQASVTALANSIASAGSANVAGTCQQFNLAVQTFAGDLSQIEQLANVGPATSAEVSAALSIAQAAITEIETPIAACAAAPTNTVAKLELQAGVAKAVSPEETLRRFNAVVDAKHRVHLHSKLARTFTFGHLQ